MHIRNVLRDVTSPLQSELRPLHFIAWWKVLLIAVQFRYNKPHIDFMLLLSMDLYTCGVKICKQASMGWK